VRRNNGSILIIEDDEDIRELLKVLLEAEGLPVNVAADGLDARRHLSTGAPPALILLDWMMPNIDGEQFLTELRASPFAQTPVIVLSGNDAAQKKARALQAYCLKKPVEFDELWHAVSQLVSPPPKRDVA
jgi:DNA-binding response OmpR family regulator